MFNDFLNLVTLGYRPRDYAMQDNLPAAVSLELIKVLLSGQVYMLSTSLSSLTTIIKSLEVFCLFVFFTKV